MTVSSSSQYSHPCATMTKKNVSFESNVALYETLHVSDLTHDEKQACWVSRSELSQTRAEVKSMARKFMMSSKKRQQRDSYLQRRKQAAVVVTTTSASWHLYFTEDKHDAREEIRRQAQDAVFVEQDFLLMATRYGTITPNDDADDNEKIAFAYRKQTSQSQHQARIAGRQLEQEVMKDHHQPHDCSDQDGGRGSISLRRRRPSDSTLLTRARAILLPTRRSMSWQR